MSLQTLKLLEGSFKSDLELYRDYWSKFTAPQIASHLGELTITHLGSAPNETAPMVVGTLRPPKFSAWENEYEPVIRVSVKQVGAKYQMEASASIDDGNVLTSGPTFKKTLSAAEAKKLLAAVHKHTAPKAGVPQLIAGLTAAASKS